MCVAVMEGGWCDCEGEGRTRQQEDADDAKKHTLRPRNSIIWQGRLGKGGGNSRNGKEGEAAGVAIGVTGKE